MMIRRKLVAALRSRSPLALGAVVLLVLSVTLFYLIVTGRIRNTSEAAPAEPVSSSSTISLIPRRLDGVLVPAGEEKLPVIGVMIENHPDARPLSGLSRASVVFEAPAEGGITRFLALFDATSTPAEIGPVRSARPYFVDWFQGFRGAYFHVGGSPDALTQLAALKSRLLNINEMGDGRFFWRADDRSMPHNTYTNHDLIQKALDEKTTTSTSFSAPIGWHFQDAATSSKRGSILNIKIPFGGKYSVNWKFDAERGVYQRSQAGKLHTDRDGSPIESENVVLIKTDSQVLDSIGRLKLRTTGSGDAVIYRDGNKYFLRWSRSGSELIRFLSTDGSEFLFTRGRVWIEVTTDDRIFAGLEAK